MAPEADTPGEEQNQSWRELRQWFLTLDLRRIVEYHKAVLMMVLREAASIPTPEELRREVRK